VVFVAVAFGEWGVYLNLFVDIHIGSGHGTRCGRIVVLVLVYIFIRVPDGSAVLSVSRLTPVESSTGGKRAGNGMANMSPSAARRSRSALLYRATTRFQFFRSAFFFAVDHGRRSSFLISHTCHRDVHMQFRTRFNHCSPDCFVESVSGR
jgi:hypothetical protein